MVKEVFITLGGEGSGKTTLSKRLSKQLNIKHFEIDKGESFFGYNKYDRFIIDAVFRNTNDVIKGIEQALSKGYNVTLLYIICSEHDRYRNLYKRLGRHCEIYDRTYDYHRLMSLKSDNIKIEFYEFWKDFLWKKEN